MPVCICVFLQVMKLVHKCNPHNKDHINIQESKEDVKSVSNQLVHHLCIFFLCYKHNIINLKKRLGFFGLLFFLGCFLLFFGLFYGVLLIFLTVVIVVLIFVRLLSPTGSCSSILDIEGIAFRTRSFLV